MNKTDAAQYRRTRASELKKLADILRRKGIVQNAEPLTSAATMCSNPPSLLEEFRNAKSRRGMEFWAYSIYELIFRDVDADCLKESIPSEISDVEITLNTSIYGICLDNNPVVVSNPFVRLSLNIETSADDKKKNKLKCAWHLDKNIVEKGDNKSKFAHPDYHFQHGGFRVSNMQNYGENLLLAVPRLAHPPLDGILAVDFVLSNYFGSKWMDLRDDSDYQKLIRSAQERCWTAYSLSTAMEWKSPINWQQLGFSSDWGINLIWPQVVSKQHLASGV